MSADGKEEAHKLSSNAWLYDSGVKRFIRLPDAGMLLAIGDRVSFITDKGPVFEADRSDIQVKWPRSGTGMLLYLTVGDQLYRLSLARPKGAATFDEARKSASKKIVDVLTEGDAKDLILGTRDLHRGRASGKAWRAYFGARMDETAPADQTAEQELE
jgi:hypothetical protein